MTAWRRTRTGGVALLALLAAPCATPAGFDALVSELDALRREHGVAGFALTLVSPRAGVQLATGGVADRASGRAVTPDTLFRIGSITKTFNALAVMRLVEQGRVALDQPLRELVPDVVVRNPWAERHPVRVAHLLEHSSGLLDLTRAEFDHNTPFATLEAAFAYRPAARLVQWPPGLHKVYSNANAGLLGLVIERVSGQRYADHLDAQVLRPLGMTGSGVTAGASGNPALAAGYDSDGRTPIPYWHMIFPPLGAVDATPRDMAALLRLLLDRGVVDGRRLLGAASIARMERPATTLAARRGLAYGYGAGLDQSLGQGLRWFGHSGDGDGHLSEFAYNRELGAGYFLTINAFDHRALAALRARVQAYLVGSAQAPEPPPATVASEALRGLTGTYQAVTRRFDWQDLAQLRRDRLEVVLDDGVLYTRTDAGRRRLLPVAPQLFRRDGQPVATIAIVADGGDVYLQAEFGNYRRINRPAVPRGEGGG